jgi:hypothetical protein
MKKIYISITFITILAAFTTLNLNAQAQVYFDPQACEATLGLNDSAIVHSVLHNMSDDTVEFSFPGYTSKGQGGPDDFGYSWIDSEEDGGPNWEWVDISETGEAVEGLGDDQCVGPFETGFNFSYYGQTKNHFWISSNGVISFDEQFIPFANGAIPTNNDYIDFIAWFWDDLMIDSAISNVFIQHYGEKVVIQFHRMVHFPGTESFITGQVILVNNGKIFFRYRQASETFEANGATVGLQSSDPAVGLQVVFNQEYVHSELAVRFDLNRNFITHVQPASLVLPPGTQETIWITYSSEGFEVGGYEQELKCVTSLPDYPHIFHHNVMHVVNENAAGFKGYVTDASTGYAINDASVYVGDHQTYTNNNGYYELPLEQGSYNVHFVREGYQPRIVEDTTALPGYSILSVTLEPLDPTYFLVGRVYAGDNFLESGFAYGYKMIEGEVVDVYADMVGEEGWYEFTGLAPAGYIIKAEPSVNSQYYGTYLPTYYGDVLHWEDATVLNLAGNTDGVHIHLIAEVSAPTGPGSISGTISNSSRTADVPIFLKTTNPDAVVMTLSGADGAYGFNNLAYGTYEIFAEIPGKSITPMVIVLSEANPSVPGANMLVLENEIVFLGIDESEVFETAPYFYPNPVSEMINLVFNMKKPAQVKVDITDISGRTVISESNHIAGMKDIRIDVTGLSKGIYLLKMCSGEEVIVKKFIKD